MKPSFAFYSTFDFVTGITNKIFSLGYDNLGYDDGYLPLPLFLLGKCAKYLIGWPLGILAGSLAAGIVAIANLFYKNNGPVNQDRPPVRQNEPRVQLAEEEEKQPNTNFKLPVLSHEERMISEKKAMEQRVFSEKKDQFLHRITALIQFITNKINLLQPQYQLYEGIKKNCLQFKADLAYQSSVSEGARKISHYSTETKTVWRCLCGATIAPICPYCRAPVYPHKVQESIPVYVPDEDRRLQAKNLCIFLSAQWKSECEKLAPVPAEYTLHGTLSDINSRLNSLLSHIKQINEDQKRLTPLLEKYLSILNEIEPLFYLKELFRKADFLPKSNYVQYFLALNMMEESKRQQGVFTAMPKAILRYIAFFTVSSDFAPPPEGYEGVGARPR